MLLIEIKSKTSNLFENNFSNTDITGGWTCTDLCDIPTLNQIRQSPFHGNFAYITDAKTIPASSMERLKGVEYLVINALRKELHMSHFNLEEALTMIARIQPKSAFLTHIGHQMGLSAEVSKELPVQVKLAYDTLEIEIPDREIFENRS